MIILFWQVLIADWKPTTKLLCQHFRWNLYCLDTLIHSTTALGLDLLLSTTFSWLFCVKNLAGPKIAFMFRVCVFVCVCVFVRKYHVR